jgi:hypothetical protein
LHGTRNARRDLENVRREREKKIQEFLAAQARREQLEAQARREEQPAAPPPERIGARSIRWKDGLRTSKANAALLVTVREFNKYQTAAGEDVPMDLDEETTRTARQAVDDGNDDNGNGNDTTSTERSNLASNAPVDHDKVGELMDRGHEIRSVVDHDMLDQPLRHGRKTRDSADLHNNPGDDIKAGTEDRAAALDDGKQRKNASFLETKHPAHKKAKRSKHGQDGKPNNYRGGKPNNYEGGKPVNYHGDKPSDFQGGKPSNFQGGKPNYYNKPNKGKGGKPDNYKGDKPNNDKGDKPNKGGKPKYYP